MGKARYYFLFGILFTALILSSRPLIQAPRLRADPVPYHRGEFQPTEHGSRLWLNVAFEITKLEAYPLPAAARLYAYTAGVFDDVLEKTNNTDQAGLAVASFLDRLVPQRTGLIELKKRQMLPADTGLSAESNDILRAYEDRLTKDNFGLLWDKKTPGANSWSPKKNQPEDAAMAGTWTTWIVPVSYNPEIQNKPMAQYPGNLLDRERTVYAVAHRTVDDLQKNYIWEGATGFSKERSPDYVSIAGIWQNILLSEKGGQLNEHDYARAQKILAQTIADTAILTWRNKYQYWNRTPIDQMPSLDTVTDTPPTPSFPSEYAGIAYASSSVLTALFPGSQPVWEMLAHDGSISPIIAGIRSTRDTEGGKELGTATGTQLIEDLHLTVLPRQKPVTENFLQQTTRLIVLWTDNRLFALKQTLDTWQRVIALKLFPTIYENITDSALKHAGNLSKKIKRNLTQGILVFDYDNDGLDDIFIPGRTQNVLLKNNGNGTFTDVAAEAGLRNEAGIGTAAVAVDLNNDGAVDLIVGHALTPGNNIDDSYDPGQGGVSVYENERTKTGKAVFKNITKTAVPHTIYPDGRTGNRYVKSITAADIDSDGCVDLYIAQNPDMDFSNYDTFMHRGGRNMLWRNLCQKNGEIAFEDITETAAPDGSLVGVPHPPQYIPPPNVPGVTLDSKGHSVGDVPGNISHAALFTDINGDGKPDLIVANDFPGSFLIFRNDTTPGHIRFTNITGDLTTMGGWMGIDSADLTGSGKFDLFLTNVGIWNHKRYSNELLKNNGDGTFEKMSTKIKVRADKNLPNLDPGKSITDLTSYEWGWGTKFLDYDNDGREDLFWFGSLGSDFYTEINGKIRINDYEKGLVNPGRFFRNLGNYQFEDVTLHAGVLDIYKPETRGYYAVEGGSGMAIGDFFNSGFPDIVLGNSRISGDFPARQSPIYIFHNRGNTNHWLKVKLVGTTSNTSAIGAKVTVTVHGHSQIKEVKAGEGYASSSTLTLFFGLGQEMQADSVVVTWPPFLQNDDIKIHTQTLKNVKSNQQIIIREERI